MSPVLWMWLVLGGISLLVILMYILITVYRQIVLTHRLALFAQDVQAFGYSTVMKHLQGCDFCNNTSHVSLWEYGNEHVRHQVLICYLCASRTERKHFASPEFQKGTRHHDGESLQREQLTYRSRSR